MSFDQIADWAEAVGVPILGRIPFERKYAETYSAGDILVEWHQELNANLTRDVGIAMILKAIGYIYLPL